MARPNKPGVSLKDLNDCAFAMDALLRAQLDLEVWKAEQAEAVATASARFEKGIDTSRALAAEMEASLQEYYYAHVTEIEAGGAKFVQLGNGRFGRRDNPPALRPLNKKWTWAAITQAVRGAAGLGLNFFHPPKYELDREKLKGLAGEPGGADRLKAVGLKVDADEKFYVEPARPAEAK